MIFVNFSNHRSDNWSNCQVKAAQAWGEIVDVPFPVVPSAADEQDIQAMAEKCVEEIMAHDPQAVMCQGEFTLTYAIVNRLKNLGVTAVSACSDRDTVEKTMPDGTTAKQSVFRFVRFRKY